MKCIRLLSVAVVAGLLLTACQGALTDRDKAGGRTRVITLASIDAVNSNGMSSGPSTFLSSLSEVSGGRLRVVVDTDTFGGFDADAESRLVKAIAGGEVDGGWPATRAFAEAGIPGLEAVEAPLTLTSYAAVGDLVSSPVAQQLLDRLSGTGVVGLGLAVGPLRRPFADGAPLLGPEDWRGQPIRSYNSPVQDATIRALGATPVRVSHAWPDAVRQGTLRGLEFDVAQYHANGMTTQAGQITGNVVLWPKVFVLALSHGTWQSLDEEQRGWVVEAAERAVTASVSGPHDEARVVAELCRNGAKVHTASATQLEALRVAVASVVEGLADDPVLARVQEVAARHPDADALDPTRCRPAPQVREVEQIEVPDSGSSLPDGVYRVEIDPEDVKATGIGAPADGITGVWTMTVRGERYAIDCTPLRESTGIDCTYGEELPADFDSNPREVGRLRGAGNTVYLTHDMVEEQRLTDCVPPPEGTGPRSCFPTSTNRVTWTLEGDVLTFTELVAEEASYYLVAEPWRRIG
jgi:TRAP-type C4-dicarboxylate transport system substrate-binding protein